MPRLGMNMTISKLLQKATIYLDKDYIKVGFSEESKILFNVWNWAGKIKLTEVIIF